MKGKMRILQRLNISPDNVVVFVNGVRKTGNKVFTDNDGQAYIILTEEIVEHGQWTDCWKASLLTIKGVKTMHAHEYRKGVCHLCGFQKE